VIGAQRLVRQSPSAPTDWDRFVSQGRGLNADGASFPICGRCGSQRTAVPRVPLARLIGDYEAPAKAFYAAWKPDARRIASRSLQVPGSDTSRDIGRSLDCGDCRFGKWKANRSSPDDLLGELSLHHASHERPVVYRRNFRRRGFANVARGFGIRKTDLVRGGLRAFYR